MDCLWEVDPWNLTVDNAGKNKKGIANFITYSKANAKAFWSTKARNEQAVYRWIHNNAGKKKIQQYVEKKKREKEKDKEKYCDDDAGSHQNDEPGFIDDNAPQCDDEHEQNGEEEEEVIAEQQQGSPNEETNNQQSSMSFANLFNPVNQMGETPKYSCRKIFTVSLVLTYPLCSDRGVAIYP